MNRRYLVVYNFGCNIVDTLPNTSDLINHCTIIIDKSKLQIQLCLPISYYRLSILYNDKYSIASCDVNLPIKDVGLRLEEALAIVPPRPV